MHSASGLIVIVGNIGGVLAALLLGAIIDATGGATTALMTLGAVSLAV